MSPSELPATLGRPAVASPQRARYVVIEEGGHLSVILGPPA